VTHYVYLALLGGCVLATLPLDLGFHLRVYARWPVLAASVLPVAAVFVAWDLVAIARRQWSFNSTYLVGVTLPGRLPLEELLFFLVVPICAVLTYEAVSTRKPDWDRAS
jgi:lycopene cyclase domain-containing protein